MVGHKNCLMLLHPTVFARDAAFDDTLEDDVRMAPGLQKKLRLTAKASCITRNTAVMLYYPPKMENQMETDVEDDMETGEPLGCRVYKVCLDPKSM